MTASSIAWIHPFVFERGTADDGDQTLLFMVALPQRRLQLSVRAMLCPLEELER